MDPVALSLRDTAMPLGRPARSIGWLPPASHPIWDRLAAAALVVAASLVLLTFGDYGVTWDEDLHSWYGIFALDYYLSWFRDQRALHLPDLVYYGAAFDMVAALVTRISPFGFYETRHLLNGLVGILGLAGCWRLGRTLQGRRTGCFALLLLLLIPNYYGQMFNNPKDIPFAVAGVWATYYMVRMLPALPRPSFWLAARLGLAIGLALGVRVGGLLFLCYLGLLLAAVAVCRAATDRRAVTAIAFLWVSLWRVLMPAAAVGFAVMLVCWPWGQQDPLGHPLRALAFFSHQAFPYKTLFDGQFIPASNLPWEYLPTYILLALPELLIVLLIGAVVLGATELWRRRARLPADAVLGWSLLGFTIVFPVAYAVAINAVLFDGMRHFIFVLPPIAVAAAAAMDRATAWLADFPFRRPVYAALGLYGAAHLATMVMLHPDQYVYYNAFIGGIEGAQRKFKLDYWANSYAEAVHGLKTYLENQYGADLGERIFTVAVCGPPASAAYYFPANFQFIPQRDKADFFIAFTKDDCDRSIPGRRIVEVERMGALLSVVLDRRAILAERLRRGSIAHRQSPTSVASP